MNRKKHLLVKGYSKSSIYDLIKRHQDKTNDQFIQYYVDREPYGKHKKKKPTSKKTWRQIADEMKAKNSQTSTVTTDKTWDALPQDIKNVLSSLARREEKTVFNIMSNIVTRTVEKAIENINL